MLACSFCASTATSTFEDGSIIGYIVGTDEHGSGLMYDFNLTLPDLPA